MKISTYTTPLIRKDNPARCNVNPIGELQWVVQWNQGVTEGGSIILTSYSIAFF